MKIKVLLSSIAAIATIALVQGNEVDINEGLSRNRLQAAQPKRGQIMPENASTQHRAVPKTRSLTDAKKSHDNPKMTPGKASRMAGKAGKDSNEFYFMGPLGCPDHCIDTSGVHLITGQLEDAVKPCDNEAKDQKWKIHRDNTFVKLESMAYPGMCIAMSGADSCEFRDTAALRDCEDLESIWYFTGGLLISAYCWINGHTNVMSAFTCTDLFVYPGSGTPLDRTDWFMFFDEATEADQTMMPNHMAANKPFVGDGGYGKESISSTNDREPNNQSSQNSKHAL